MRVQDCTRFCGFTSKCFRFASQNPQTKLIVVSTVHKACMRCSQTYIYIYMYIYLYICILFDPPRVDLQVCRACASFYKRAVTEGSAFECRSGRGNCDLSCGESIFTLLCCRFTLFQRTLAAKSVAHVGSSGARPPGLIGARQKRTRTHKSRPSPIPTHRTAPCRTGIWRGCRASAGFWTPTTPTARRSSASFKRSIRRCASGPTR